MEKRRIGVRAIIWREGKLLAVKHKKKDGSAANFWAIPGGGLDPGEALEDGLRREVFEELGVQAKVGRLLFIQQFKSTRQDRDEELEFFFLVENSDDFAAIDYSGTSHGLAELAACEFIDAADEFVLPRFISKTDISLYADTVRPVLVANMFREDDVL